MSDVEVDPMAVDVVVAGAGPVGLLLACELRLGGCTVRVLEKAADPHSPLKGLPLGLRGLNAPSVDALDRRGLLEPLQALQPMKPTAAGAPPGAHWMLQKRTPAGHFAGLQFFQDRIDPARWPWRQAGHGGNQLPTDIAAIEAVLSARAQALGVQVLRGHGVDDVQQDADGVHVQAAGQCFRARWLVGCDGARSAVRKACGFEVDATEPEFTGYSLQVELDDVALLPPGRHFTATGMYTFTPPSMIALVDFDGGRFHRSALTPAHAQDVLRRVSGTQVGIDVLQQGTTWTDRALQARNYRQGRVLLAGDAAHIHSPLGGQGLNLGLGDAMNLGWKLAAVVRGDQEAGLLDSYAAERHPLGAAVLEWSRAQVALMRPDRGTRALRDVIGALMDTADGAGYFAGRVSGVEQRLALGESHALLGRSAPDLQLADGRRLAECLRTGAALLLAFEAAPVLQAQAARWAGRVQWLQSEVRDRFDAKALLARPDGIVAWVLGEDGAQSEALESVLCHWFGPADTAATQPAAC